MGVLFVLATAPVIACAQARAAAAVIPALIQIDSPRASADSSTTDSLNRNRIDEVTADIGVAPHFRSERDSLEWYSARSAAERSSGFRLVISLFDRRLWVVRGADTLRTAVIAVGMDSTLVWQETEWDFRTPRGRHTIRRKQRNPIWVPPDWHYVEAATNLGLELRQIERGRPVLLDHGRRIEVRGERISLVESDGAVVPFAREDEIIVDDVLYIPPFGTINRQIEGELGRFRLDLGGGYLLHGTPHYLSIGEAATHGCIRLDDDDIQWLYSNVPTGTRVYIY
ncbi:MAG TPA: L,D-transpeptidase [Gemmatimonadaceae bacterium]|nr:L,D-transpeptidase [Gemmatimonadaceae bacterium]